MTDQQPQTLAERALVRLRKVASGNGVEPAAITLLEVQEKDFTFGGKMEVSPLCETTSVSYPGGVRGKDRKMVATFALLQETAAAHKKDFRENPGWIAATTAEIKSHETEGWGLENAKVTLPEKSAVYAATQNCPSCDGRQMLTCTHCQGRGTVTCTQCQGQGREMCYYCAGRGEDPQQPGQRCHTCNGTRYAPCRFCQTRGYLPCPTCGGKRGTPCPTCQATGSMTQEISVTCGAETHFKLLADNLPSGLRRGLDRIGIENIGKGHADITASLPAQEDGETPKEGAPIPILLYQVTVPYAELRVGFGGKKAVVSVVGKRCAISGVPNFLDQSLKPWRDKLRLAALGSLPLEESLEARALNEILSLTIAGKGQTQEIRKLYPFGLSSEVLTSILSDMRLALNRTTLKTRAAIALLCAAVCSIFFYILFMEGIEARLTLDWNLWAALGADMIVLICALGASWAALNFSTRAVLRRRFPQLKLALQQKIGKTGYTMIGGIIALFALCATLAPVKPLWLVALFMR